MSRAPRLITRPTHRLLNAAGDVVGLIKVDKRDAGQGFAQALIPTREAPQRIVESCLRAMTVNGASFKGALSYAFGAGFASRCDHVEEVTQ